MKMILPYLNITGAKIMHLETEIYLKALISSYLLIGNVKDKWLFCQSLSLVILNWLKNGFIFTIHIGHMKNI